MTLIYAYQGRGLTKDITITDSSGAAVTVGLNDVLRVTIGRKDMDPKLTVASDAPTAAGSSFTKNGGDAANSHRLRLDASDLSFSPGTYTMFVDYFDNADAGEWKNVDRQVFVLEAT